MHNVISSKYRIACHLVLYYSNMCNENKCILFIRLYLFWIINYIDQFIVFIFNLLF